ncbi:MAG TPA: sugar transferase [Gaiellaceae bacterium]|nr:sugar transferase [Gaiellaceae bacterium]
MAPPAIEGGAVVRLERGSAVPHREAPLRSAAAKRLLDLAVATALLVLLAPVFALVALAIVLDSGAPVFYRCRRAGLRGRALRMLKFRKMVHDAAGPGLTVSGDTRFTRVGRVLARTKLDELPQLWHVITGEMSLVGPRPEDPDLAREFVDDYGEILSVRPGITGLSQLAFVDEAKLLGPEDPTADYLKRIMPQKVALDRLYVARRTIGMDLRILAWTAAAIVLRRSVAVQRETGGLGSRRRPREDHGWDGLASVQVDP